MSTATRPTIKRTGKPISGALKVLLAVLSVAGVILFAVVFVWLFGSVYGTEICAETLERRTYFYLEIPIVGYQVRGVTHHDLSGDLEKHLATTNLVQTPAKKTWHTVLAGRGVFAQKINDPAILIRYLEARNANMDLAWLEWTKANPKIAPYIWKGVTDLALAGEYTLIPDVLELSQGAQDADKVKAAVDQVVKRAAPQPGSTPKPAQAEAKKDEAKKPEAVEPTAKK